MEKSQDLIRCFELLRWNTGSTSFISIYRNKIYISFFLYYSRLYLDVNFYIDNGILFNLFSSLLSFYFL